MKELKDLWIRLMSGLRDFPWPSFLAITLIWCSIGWIEVFALYKENRQLIKDNKTATDATIQAQNKLLKRQDEDIYDKDNELLKYHRKDTSYHR